MGMSVHHLLFTRFTTMPLLQLSIGNAELTSSQSEALQSGLTSLMARLLAKQAELTVVSLECRAASHWSAAGQSLPQNAWVASLVVFITAGTNTAGEQARFISEADQLLRRHMASPPSAPLYIVIHEVPASNWGYDGVTQQVRHAARLRSIPPTLKALSGQDTPQVPESHGTALLLIDFQREYSDAGALPLTDFALATAQATLLVEAAQQAGVPVVHVHHEATSTTAALFAPGSSGVQALGQLPVAATHHRIVKHWPSAFKDTNLSALLDQWGVRRLVLAGCMTHNCVDSTARQAMHMGYEVTVVRDACATRALPDGQGGVLSARQVHQVCLSALADRHAQVFDVHDICSAWSTRVS
jgi:nicotinamidase-related amidase/phenylpyruvate tautomerase PptA (4-oxalocrotonate tautomerase family)